MTTFLLLDFALFFFPFVLWKKNYEQINVTRAYKQSHFGCMNVHCPQGLTLNCYWCYWRSCWWSSVTGAECMKVKFKSQVEMNAKYCISRWYKTMQAFPWVWAELCLSEEMCLINGEFEINIHVFSNTAFLTTAVLYFSWLMFTFLWAVKPFLCDSCVKTLNCLDLPVKLVQWWFQRLLWLIYCFLCLLMHFNH